MTTNNPNQSDLPSVNFERVFDVTPEVVFSAWTEPERLKRWIAPDGFTTPVAEIDARACGKMNIVMRGPDGTDYPSTGVLREFDPPNRLVWESSVQGPDGTVVLVDRATATFERLEGNKTRLRVLAQVTSVSGPGLEYARGMEEGWTQSLAHLEQVVMS